MDKPCDICQKQDECNIACCDLVEYLKEFTAEVEREQETARRDQGA